MFEQDASKASLSLGASSSMREVKPELTNSPRRAPSIVLTTG